MNTLPLLRTVAAGALAAAALSACVVAPAPYPAEPAVVIRQAPPAPYVEVVPVAPYPGAIWIGGYWGWSRNRHEWVPGHYERPRPGYRWKPRHWQQQPQGGWALEGGVWVR